MRLSANSMLRNYKGGRRLTKAPYVAGLGGAAARGAFAFVFK